MLGLTYRLAEAARQVDPSLELIIGIAQPWGEYMALADRTHSPFIFADTLIRSGLNLAALDLEMVMGVTPRGSYCRDLARSVAPARLVRPAGRAVAGDAGLSVVARGDRRRCRSRDARRRRPLGQRLSARTCRPTGPPTLTALALCKPYVQGVPLDALLATPSRTSSPTAACSMPRTSPNPPCSNSVNSARRISNKSWRVAGEERPATRHPFVSYSLVDMLLPTDRWTRALLAPALVLIATAVDRNYQTDLWHHLARGRAIVAEGRLLNADRFTYTVHGQPVQDVNWGWQVCFYELYSVGGLPLVQAANSAILALMMAVLVGLAWRRSGSLLAASAVCVFAFFGLWQMLIIRPQTLSLLLFVVLYAILEAAPRRRGLLLLPPLVMAVWVNVHGGFPIGLVLIGCYALGSGIKWVAGGGWRVAGLSSPATRHPPPATLPALCLAESIAATLANPYGWRVYEYVALTSNRASGRPIDEWLPPGLNLLTGKVWVLSLLLLLVLFALARRRPRWIDICLLAAFLPLACGSVRMVAWWLLIVTPILAAQVADRWPRLRPLDVTDDRPSVGNALACAVLVAAMVLSLPWFETFNPVLSQPGRSHRTENDLQAIADRLSTGGHGGRIFTRFRLGRVCRLEFGPALHRLHGRTHRDHTG